MTEHDLFAAALNIEAPADRSDYLDEACGGDDLLRERVECCCGPTTGRGFPGRPRRWPGSRTLTGPPPDEHPNRTVGIRR